MDERQKQALDQIGREVREAGTRIATAWRRFGAEMQRRLAADRKTDDR